MGERLDRFRSLVRRAAQGAAETARGVGPVANAIAAARELRERKIRIPERDLARAVLRAGTIAAASVRTRNGRIELTIELESGRVVHAALIPERASFAPRGAKELLFAVDPPEAASDSKLRDVAGAISTLIARAIWGPLLPPSDGDDGAAIVDREGEKLRVDLRTCPAVRAIQNRGATAVVMDVVGVESLEVDDNGISIRLGLPRVPG